MSPAAGPRRRAAGGRRPRRAARLRPRPGAGRSRHGQDDHAGGGGRGAGRRWYAARADPDADVQPQGGRGAARPDHHPARPRADRSRPGPSTRSAYALVARDPAARGRRAAAAAAVRARAGRRRARAAGGRPRRRAAHDWPTELGVAWPPAASPTRSARCSPAPAATASSPRDLGARGRGAAGPTGRGRRASSPSTSRARRPRRRSTTPSWSTARCCSPRRPAGRRRCARGTTSSSSTSTRTPTRPGAAAAGLAGDGRDLVVVGDPDQSIYAFRGADVRGLLDFRGPVPHRRRLARRTALALQRLPPGRRRPAGRVPSVARRTAVSRRPGRARFARTATLEPAPGRHPGTVEVATYSVCHRRQLDAVADILRRAHLDGGMPWGDMAVLVRSGARSIPLAPARSAPPASPSRSPATSCRWPASRRSLRCCSPCGLAGSSRRR